jgi:hypothetical protein
MHPDNLVVHLAHFKKPQAHRSKICIKICFLTKVIYYEPA